METKNTQQPTSMFMMKYATMSARSVFCGIGLLVAKGIVGMRQGSVESGVGDSVRMNQSGYHSKHDEGGFEGAWEGRYL